MTEDLSHGEIQELLGAYALGAVDARERAIIEAHLATCDSCRVELDDHSRLAETLRRHASRVSPLASVEANGGTKTPADVPRRRPLRRWWTPVAIAIMLVLLGGVLAHGEIRFDDLETTMERIELRQRAQLATADPAAVVTSLRTPRNEPVLTVVSRPAGGESYAMNSYLQLLAQGETYLLWRVDNGGVTAAAALGPAPAAVVFTLPQGVTGFLVTVEKSPSPSRPTLPAVASAVVSL
ncbi:MAG: zf-HC2 domain-containing protein [Acidimicrobiales bacterium]